MSNTKHKSSTSFQEQSVRCIGCGYDLRGAPDVRCPECGSVHTIRLPINRAIQCRTTKKQSLWFEYIVVIWFTLYFIVPGLHNTTDHDFDYGSWSVWLFLYVPLQLILTAVALTVRKCKSESIVAIVRMMKVVVFALILGHLLISLIVAGGIRELFND